MFWIWINWCCMILARSSSDSEIVWENIHVRCYHPSDPTVTFRMSTEALPYAITSITQSRSIRSQIFTHKAQYCLSRISRPPDGIRSECLIDSTLHLSGLSVAVDSRTCHQ